MTSQHPSPPSECGGGPDQPAPAECVPPLKLILNYKDAWGDSHDVIESEDGSVCLWLNGIDRDVLRLFATAPELLAACEAFADYANSRRTLADIHIEAVAAIRKAKGES